MPTDYFLARSLAALRGEINDRWPNRDKSTDGWIGDASHQARPSDHNPDWNAPGDRRGVVRAIDVDKDGLGIGEVLAQLAAECKRPSPRVAYVIYNRHMMRSYPKTIGGRTYQPGQWAPYDGPSPHTGHFHVSINHTAAAENDTRPWLPPPAPPTGGDDMTPEQYQNVMKFLVTISGNVAVLMGRELVDDAEKDRRLAELEALIREHSQ